MGNFRNRSVVAAPRAAAAAAAVAVDRTRDGALEPGAALGANGEFRVLWPTVLAPPWMHLRLLCVIVSDKTSHVF
ncbi:unnamed protein product [Pylaiella littoralis]